MLWYPSQFPTSYQLLVAQCSEVQMNYVANETYMAAAGTNETTSTTTAATKNY